MHAQTEGIGQIFHYLFGSVFIGKSTDRDSGAQPGGRLDKIG